MGNFDLAPVSTELQYLQHDISERADKIQQMKNSIDWMKGIKLNIEDNLDNNNNFRKIHKEAVKKFNMEKTVRKCLQHKNINIHFDAVYKDLEVEESLWNRQLKSNKIACKNIIKGLMETTMRPTGISSAALILRT